MCNIAHFPQFRSRMTLGKMLILRVIAEGYQNVKSANFLADFVQWGAVRGIFVEYSPFWGFKAALAEGLVILVICIICSGTSMSSSSIILN
jgi:hypothetical protein